MVLLLLLLMSPLNAVSSQNLTLINVEQKSDNILKIDYMTSNYTSNNITYCTIEDNFMLRIPIFCPTMVFYTKSNINNFQLPMPIEMIEFDIMDTTYNILISSINYDEYYWMLGIDRNNGSCQRCVVHKQDLNECLGFIRNKPTTRIIVIEILLNILMLIALVLYGYLLFKIGWYLKSRFETPKPYYTGIATY